MSPHFWLWILYIILVLGGGWYWRGTAGANRYWYGPPLILAVFLFVVCWSIAGNPLTVLVKG